MKKIGILTYHASHNIGSMLQSYALQTYLETTYKYDIEFIDYSSPAQRNMYSIFPKLKSGENKKPSVRIIKLLKTISRFLFYPWLKMRFYDFENFKNKNLHLSKHNYILTDQIDELENEYEHLFLGSDQIWNINCEDFTDAYFADFKTNANIIAYAPSLGGQNIFSSNTNLEKLKNLINKIEYLSVREVNGKKWLEELTNRHVEIVVDPTLLLSKKIWHEFLNNHKKENKYQNYIFFYGVPFSNKTYSVLEKISKRLGMKVVMLDIRSYISNNCYKRGFILEKRSSPLDYLHLIKNSSLVITTSFHGTIFSTIFEKNFWTVTFEGTNPEDDRIFTLLNHLGLEERLIYLEKIDSVNLTKDVDYSNYDISLEKLISNSTKFIHDSIQS